MTAREKSVPPRTRVQEVAGEEAGVRVFVVDSEQRREYEQGQRAKAMEALREQLEALLKRVAAGKLKAPEKVAAAAARILDRESLYRRHHFPPEITSHAVWLYHRFTLSFRDVEDLLAERGITVSYEAIRSWCRKFGPAYARTLRRRQGRLGDIWHVDEVFITIRDERHYLWKAVVSFAKTP